MEQAARAGSAGVSRPQRWAADLRRLRWGTVVLPVLFLLGFALLQREDPEFWFSPAGFFVTAVVLAAAVAAFAASVFREIQRIEARAARRAAQIEALNRLAAATAENLDLGTTISRGLDEIVAATGADASLVCRLHADEAEHSAVGARGFSDAMLKRLQRAKLEDDFIASEVVQTRRPVRFGDVFDDPDVRRVSSREGIHSGISVPLISGGKVNGIVVVAYRSDYRFDEDDHAFLAGVGQQLGIAIHNAEQYEESVQRNRDLSALLRVQAAVSSSLDLDEVLARALGAVTQLTTAAAVEIWLPDGEDLVSHASEGGAAPLLGTLRTPAEGGVLGDVTELQHAVCLLDSAGRGGAPFAIRCMVPMRFAGRLVGVMVLGSDDTAALGRPAALRLIETIADQIAAAIDNASLHRAVAEVSTLRERERISREMHDGLAQVLGYVNTQAQAVRKLLDSGRLEAAGEELQRLDAAARSVYADVRDGILALRAAPGRDGLAEAIAEYVRSFREMFNLDVTLEVTPEARAARTAPGTEVQLIRIVQQALTNVRQHAGAATVRVRLSREGDRLVAEVADDGAGFRPDQLAPAGRPRFGLQTMRERAQGAGGTFEVESTPGQGTRVTVRMPLRP